jgi:hypothetical protein
MINGNENHGVMIWFCIFDSETADIARVMSVQPS